VGEEYLTVTEAREKMQISQNKIARMIATGELPTIPNPRNKASKLIPLSAVENWLKQASVRPPIVGKKHEEKPMGRPAPAFSY
jgi:excisionase family DNA binding protein